MAINIKNNALAIVENYYQNYGIRAGELKKQGNRIIGYLCAFTPLEILHAAGFLPIRIKGNARESVTSADTQMETLVCPLVRHCYDMASKNNYDFLDGLVIPHACDSISRTYPIWKYTLNLHYSHFINMPHGTDASSIDFFREELNMFIRSLGKFKGSEITADKLVNSINTFNTYRAKVRELFNLRKSNPPLITGEEMTKVLVAGMSIPVEEAITLVSNVITEIKQRPPTKNNKSRIMVFGAEIDDASFIKLIEDCGSSVVTDDLCPGAREYSHDVATTMEPVEAIARRYLLEIKCGRTYRESKGSYQQYLEARFGHISSRIKDFKVDGVLIYIYRFCDPFGFEVPAIKSYIETLNTPVFYLEGNYSMGDAGRLQTRIQAFIEQINQK